MEYKLIGYSQNKEIKLNDIAQYFSIKKKFVWEDFLVLKNGNLRKINIESDNKYVYFYSYGVIVFVNFTKEEINSAKNQLIELKLIEESNEVWDDFYIKTDNSIEKNEIDFDEMILKEFKEIYLNLAGLVLSKSIALEKTEKDIEKLLDSSETSIEMMRKNSIFNKKKLSKITADILNFKYDTLSNVMILDKPNVIWDNEEAEKIYDELLEIFDINSRYTVIENKTDFLFKLVTTIHDMSSVRHASFLEWIIIILIAFEIVYAFVEKI